MGEFKHSLEDPIISSYLVALGLDIKDAEMFFRVLSEVAGRTELKIDEFTQNCVRMKGVASGIDLQQLAFKVKLIHEDLSTLMARDGLIAHNLTEAVRETYPSER